jgi:hypothetical protein
MSRVAIMLMQTLFLVPEVEGRGRGGVITCFTCGKNGHKSFECPEKKRTEEKLTSLRRRGVMLRMKMQSGKITDGA